MMYELVSSFFGILGSGMIAVPAFQHQSILQKYKAFFDMEDPMGFGEEMHIAARASKNRELNSMMMEWCGVKYYSVILGCSLLALSFIFSALAGFSDF